MDRWQAMKVFIRVADCGSFAQAGRDLRMSPPAVTRAIAFLEEITGARLLTRTTRSVKLTEAGDRYMRDCRRILDDLAEAEAAAGGAYATPTGTLTVTAPVLFGKMFVMPILMAFLDENPGMRGQVLLLDRVVNVVEEGMDLAVRIGHLTDSGLSAVRVGAVKRLVCAAPAYFARYGRPEKPADLAAHRIIGTTNPPTTQEWRFGRTEKVAVVVQPTLLTNATDAALQAALDGWGIARLLSYQISPALASGQLETVLEQYDENPVPIHLVHPEGRRASAKVRAFIDFATKRLRANPAVRKYE
ncbi:LysR family transcriptional regulator [Thalassospira sp. MCCC 1A01428]|jgi:DNA-binding transcriptional LysR family regulator|uniref:LysR family transcriptional regulator n=1 Tax=Thalassospira sp. MCCC 1A01428 TaxID=1470575 RepID=UPI000A1F87B9|nr:LysR family transcriptional regulator [Thalassospira sp. MCCC 1A01428]OSQ42712.1 LysR family transcriptional regulator [Thalassospira sp. MCCC 1A01428]